MNGRFWSKDPEVTNAPVTKTTEVDKIMLTKKKEHVKQQGEESYTGLYWISGDCPPCKTLEKFSGV